MYSHAVNSNPAIWNELDREEGERQGETTTTTTTGEGNIQGGIQSWLRHAMPLCEQKDNSGNEDLFPLVEAFTGGRI